MRSGRENRRTTFRMPRPDATPLQRNTRSYQYDRRERQMVYVDEWIYDFGPDRLRRRFVFEDGWLVRVETAGYGR